ncbi:AAA family ATPase [Nonomuraea sp. NPDC048826]|uniref:helix-turn-helix transcriptional regulator n=1 Tax=Nonomuraea sp. NPDC048826 TaxID=3364347 RepID=UPI00371415B2
MLYGRATEIAAIQGVIDAAAAGAGQALLLRGEAGIGKSTLLDLAAEHAGPRTTVLRACGAEAEADLAFAALHQLLRPVTGLLDALPGPQREAVAGALGLAAPSEDRFLVAAGVLSLLAEAAADGGVLCLVDDLQWLDRASADALLFTARRVRTERIGMLLAVRGDGTYKGVPEIRVRGLDDESAATLVDARASAAPAVRARLITLTGGNPLVLGETLSSLTPDQLTGLRPLPDPLPGGAQLFGDPITRLSAPARHILLAASLEPDTTLTLHTAARMLSWDAKEKVTGAGLKVAAAGLDEAEQAGLVVVDGAVIRFRHPLVRSAMHAAAGPVEVRRAHAVLAELVEGDRRAWHLASAAVGQDEQVAAALAASAGRARARGGYGDAATALGRAAELTPDPWARARRYTDAATAAWLGGRPGQAQTYLAEARALTTPPSLPDDLYDSYNPLDPQDQQDGDLQGRRRLQGLQGPQAQQGLQGARGPYEHRDPYHPQDPTDPAPRWDGLRREVRQLRGRFELNSGDAVEAVRILGADDSMELLADASEAASYAGDVRALVEIGRRAAAHPPGFLRDVVAGIGRMLDDGGGVALLRGALERVDELREAAEFLWASAAASHLGEADLSAELVERAGRVARVSGMVGQLPVVLEFVSTAERLKGRLAESEAIAEEGLALAREAGYTNSEAAHLANLAVVAALRGAEEACREHARRALAIAVPHRVGLRAGVASYALAMLDLGLGRYDAAHARFSALAATGHPTVVWRSTPDRVEAAVAAGEPGSAREALEGLERWAAHARTPESRALLLRCRALVDGDAALFEEAARLHGEPFEAARTALLHGERLRRAHRPGQARAHLRSALETFTRLRAEPWARRASGELRAAGETAGAPGAVDVTAALTPQEARIARLVAEGASSKEVAARLFLSPRTVEYHLYKIYPKLGITSRTELARLL